MIRPRPTRRWFCRWICGCAPQFKGRFLLHHCGIFHPYVDVYKPLNPTGWDLGWGTDLRVARAAFPDLPISTYIDVSALRGITAKEWMPSWRRSSPTPAPGICSPPSR